METPSQPEANNNTQEGEPDEAFVDVSAPEIIEGLDGKKQQLIEDNWSLFQTLNQASDMSEAFEPYRNKDNFSPEGEQMQVYDLVKNLKEKHS